MTRLRRSVWVEVVIAAVILGITAMLVNAAPARSQSVEPVSLTLKSSQVWVVRRHRAGRGRPQRHALHRAARRGAVRRRSPT